MAELQAKFAGQVEVELIAGDRGIFDVTLDGALIYSKFKTGSFPRYREVPDLITQRM